MSHRPTDRIRDAELHLITRPCAESEWPQQLADIEACVGAGVTVVQYRSKDRGSRAASRELDALRPLLYRHRALLIVNDRVDWALACEADGVHLGVDDLDWQRARSLIGERMLLGCTAATPERVSEALHARADYIGAGPAFGTETKVDVGPQRAPADYRELAAAARDAPLVAVGGVAPGRAGALIEAGCRSVAVSAAILADAEPAARAAELIEEVRAARAVKT